MGVDHVPVGQGGGAATGSGVTWRSYCLEIRDDYGVAPTVPEQLRETAIAAHALSHRMLRIFEAARTRAGEVAVDALYTEWGRRFFVSGSPGDAALLRGVPGGLRTRRRSRRRGR